MLVSGRGVLMSLLAVFVRGLRVFLRLLVLAEVVMMGGLMVMMRGGVVMSGGLMMMLARRMLRLCHGVVPPNRQLKTILVSSGFQSAVPSPLSAQTDCP